MRTVDIITCVRDRTPLQEHVLSEWVQHIVDGSVPDYQVTAFLMAVFFNGLSDANTTEFTLAMRDSGTVIDLSSIPGIKVDKHSTGGVGDKISLPLAPLVAACGVPVPMVSGRGLGHTGGTLDKLESIPGFRVHLSVEEFTENLKKHRVALMGQTKDLAPADKKLYALRDVTATVESVPLITSSILSKKLAEGIDALVLDVKVGAGAFMKDLASARTLARSLVRVGSAAGLRIKALLTRMEEPLGTTIGNALEVKESIDILKGCGPADTTELTYALAAEMLVLGGVSHSVSQARHTLEKALISGEALRVFQNIIEAQGGDPRVVDNPSLLPQAPQQTHVFAHASGYVHTIDSYTLGVLAMQWGAGRAKAEDRVDPAVGIVLHKTLGSYVEKNEPLCTIHHRDALVPSMLSTCGQAFQTQNTPCQTPALLIETMDTEG
jgi:pyrimidine-nucleoside phosphorylase